MGVRYCGRDACARGVRWVLAAETRVWRREAADPHRARRGLRAAGLTRRDLMLRRLRLPSLFWFMPSLTLRARLTIWYGAVLGLTLLVFGAYLQVTLSRQV